MFPIVSGFSGDPLQDRTSGEAMQLFVDVAHTVRDVEMTLRFETQTPTTITSPTSHTPDDNFVKLCADQCISEIAVVLTSQNGRSTV